MPAAPTYEPIQSYTVSGSSTTTLTFNSIPSSYTDLRVVLSGMTNSVNEIQVRVNNDSGSLYSRTYIEGNGSAVSTARNSNGSSWLGAWVAAGVNGQIAIHDYINYKNTTTFKSMLNTASTNNLTFRAIMLYRSTSAISRLDYFVATSNFNAGVNLTLYGIKEA